MKELVRSPGLVVSGLAIRDGMVLMGQRKAAARRGGLWELPGGKVDRDNETPEEALAREWWEELRLRVTVGDWLAATPVLDLETRFVVELYEVTIVHGTLAILDHEDVRWVDAAHMVERVPCSPAFYLHYPAVRARLARGAQGT